jgi:RHS repeat-associated protein
MKKMVLLILSVFFFADYAFAQCVSPTTCSNQQSCILPSCQLDSDNKGFLWNYEVVKRLSPNRRTEFWVGEDVSVPVECCDCIEGQTYYATDPVNNRTLELRVERNSGLTPEELASYSGDISGHWRYKQGCYHELVGKASQPGSYNGSINLEQLLQSHFHYRYLSGMGPAEDYDRRIYDHRTIPFSFEVKELNETIGNGPKPNNKAVIVSRDAAASYSDQAEIYSYLKNNSGFQQTLDNPFMDYYMTLPNDQQVGVFSIWKLPENSCIQVIECDNNNYIFRHKYSGMQTLNAGASLGEFQLALYDAPSTRGNLDWFDHMAEKQSDVNTNEDFSYLYPAENYDHAAARYDHYNYKMASFDKNGTLLYGSFPSWLNSSCHIIQPKERVQNETSRIQYRTTSAENLRLCTDNDVFIPSIYRYYNLDVQFRDSELAQNHTGYFDFRIVNTGNQDLNLNGFQIRFFYGETSYDPSRVKYYVRGGNPAGPWSVERCRDDMYVLKINLTSFAQVNAGGFYPGENQWRMLFEAAVDDWSSGINLEKQKMFSWKNTSEFISNENIGLYDPNGVQIFGRKDLPVCDGGHGGNGGDNGGGNGGDNGGEVITNSNLKVQFFDEQATNDYYGDFQFKVANVGTADAQIGGYELRFYYSDNKNLENASIAFAPNYVDNGSLSFEQCADNKYIMRLKLNSGASVKAGGKYPENDPLKAGVSSKKGQINKKSMDSWNNASVLTDNLKMSLYDASGRHVYGVPTPSCGQSVHDSEDDEKKRQEYKYKYLSIQFQDTEESIKTQNGDFKFQIRNSGDDDFPIGNYEMRFFFESEKDKFDASDIGFIPGNLANSQVTKEWCGDGRYFMKIKMASDAVVKADNHFPEYYPITVSVRRLSKENEGIYLDYYKNDLFSWDDLVEMADNQKMGLFDASGARVWGNPGYKCENPITVTPGSKIDQSRFLVEETEKLLPFKFYDEDKKKNVTLENGINEVSLKVKNVSELDEAGPVYVDYYITHPVGQNPLFCYSRGTTCFASSSSSNVEFLVPDVVFDLRSDLSVKRMSTGNKHVYRFTLKNGLKKKSEVEFKFSLRDECADCLIEEPKPGPYITIPNPGMILCEYVDKEGLEPIEGCDREWDPTKYFIWKIEDDWSAESGLTSEYTKTERVVIYSKDEVVLYGYGDDGDAKFKNSNGYIPIPGITVQELFPNRTDAVAYSGGQLLLNGDFEDPSLIGWDLDDGVGSSIRGSTVQGSRFLRLNGSVSQKLPPSTTSLLLDSGAVLSFWHRSESCKENQANNEITVTAPYSQAGSAGPRPNTDINTVYEFNCSKKWKNEVVLLTKESFIANDNGVSSITFTTSQNIDFDDITLIPGRNALPSTYAVRFTTTQHEEIQTRAYDNDRERVLVTNSKRDAMGRNRYKYLPFELMCSDAENCNVDPVTLSYPEMARDFYNGNPDYADAKGFPYVETLWKPDPAATKDVVGAAGKAFSLDEGADVHHVTRSYSSGINLTGIDKMDFNSLASAVNAVRNCRVFEEKDCRIDGKSDDGVYNFHAAKDVNPTHTWELIIDPNGNAAFTVKDGEGHTIISGAMKKTQSTKTGDVAYELYNRSVNELDARGNVLKSHSPLSCEYKNASQANCVRPNTYDYDSESRVIKSWEPDAGTTLTYYDFAGRIRATQSQKQIANKTASVLVYDHLDRVVATGEWNHGYDESNLGTLRTNLLSDESDVNNGFTFPKENDLTPGTITRTFYDKVPSRTLLGVELYPDGVNLHNTRGRVAAVVSDVKDDGNGNVVRVSSANSYDKYGRVVTNYSYDPTMPEDSLKMLAVATQYDLSGKVVATTKFPYGITIGGQGRAVNENYIYDRLGRLYMINSKNGTASSAEIARYDYYPTGAVKSITMGKSIILSYTYHISGAVKTAEVKAANGMKLYSEKLYYEDFEDCGSTDCKPQFNGNISRMFHQMAHTNSAYGKERDVAYIYDELNRLTRVKDSKQPMFDEMFEYDAQGRITAQHRAQQQNGAFALAQNPTGGEYTYEGGSNKLKSVADGMGGATADARHMGDNDNFEYDSEGNLTFDKSKQLQISYDWRGMPVEFTQIAKPVGSSDNKLYKLVVNYDGSGRRISKTSMYKDVGASDWQTSQVTHYTGIGTEIRENFAGTAPETKVVVNLPQGLGRYEVENAAAPDMGGLSGEQLAGYIPNAKFEWYVKNHLGSTMLVFGTEGNATSTSFPVNAPLAVYDYRAFGEMVTLTQPSDKVTENFTGKEHDEEIKLDYFGARYLDPMLGLWISVDTKRQFSSPYLYVGNGMNPMNVVDPDGNAPLYLAIYYNAKRGEGKYKYDNVKYTVSVKEMKTYISDRVDTKLNQVEVKAFKEGEAMKMMEWLNESGSTGFRAIMTHGGEGRMYITDVPFTDKEPGQHRISYDDLERHLWPTFIGQCWGKDNIDTKKYPSLIPPSEGGEIYVNQAAAQYLIDNATKPPEPENKKE